MTPFTGLRTASWALLLLCALAGPLAGQDDRPRIVYLANEGVMIEGRGGRVLIDALFGDGLPDYPTVPALLRDSLERALGRFGGPTLVLATHPHRDHFDSAAVARHLAGNGKAAVLYPPRTPEGGLPAPVDAGWVKVQPLPIPHGPTSRPVGHAALLVTIDGTTVVHLGDSNGNEETLATLRRAARGVDVALVPYWYALDDEGFQALLDAARPGTVVLLHVAVPAARSGRLEGRGGWEAVAGEIRRRHPNVRTPGTAGEVVELDR